ncbi:hypothetical protein NXS19_000237 [Fusarium pseudograminearum]|nr:hypothetical protein NXS19_000237 [Fusarium pseudograminearum]
MPVPTADTKAKPTSELPSASSTAATTSVKTSQAGSSTSKAPALGGSSSSGKYAVTILPPQSSTSSVPGTTPSLFSNLNISSQPQFPAGGLFGNAGKTVTQQQPQSGAGLFGSQPKPVDQQQPPVVGLFGSQPKPVEQQKPPTVGLFGSQPKPVDQQKPEPVGLFGSQPKTAAQQQRPTSRNGKGSFGGSSVFNVGGGGSSVTKNSLPTNTTFSPSSSSTQQLPSSWTQTQIQILERGPPYFDMRSTSLFPTTHRFLHICHLQRYKASSPEELRFSDSLLRATRFRTTEPDRTVESKSVSWETPLG